MQNGEVEVTAWHSAAGPVWIRYCTARPEACSALALTGGSLTLGFNSVNSPRRCLFSVNLNSSAGSSSCVVVSKQWLPWIFRALSGTYSCEILWCCVMSGKMISLEYHSSKIQCPVAVDSSSRPTWNSTKSLLINAIFFLSMGLLSQNKSAHQCGRILHLKG